MTSQLKGRRRIGLTLIEVMIATTLTLLLLLSLAQGFKSLSETVSAGRSRLALNDQLRGISSLLRMDLEGITVDSTNPQQYTAATGYFKYYDGPLSDTSATLFNYLQTGTVEQRVGSNRWGDIDDILMFTSKAKDGDWFQGKVPLALLYINNLNKGLAVPISTQAQWAAAWATDVNIASQYAEIAWFMRPLDAFGGLTAQEITGGIYGPVPPEIEVIDSERYVDLNGDGVLDPDGMPDKLALCRRVLLVRPDLDISRNALTNQAFVGLDPQLTMSPFSWSSVNPNAGRYMMRFAYQRSDVSVRAVRSEFAAFNSATGIMTLQTNSLSDLQLPENRFAHYIRPLPNSSTTLPMLALTSESSSTGNFLALFDEVCGAVSPAFSSVNLTPTDRGFIPASFFRTQITLDSTNPSRVGASRATLEELVASNVVAFDIKGYDRSVKLLASPGADGGWGTRGVDDDLATPLAVDDLLEAGWPGTDDLSLSPSDPGYSRIVALAASASPVFAKSGAFVDIDWSRKVINAPHRLASGKQRIGMAGFPSLPTSIASLWVSNLSGVQLTSTNSIEPSFSFVRSGAVSLLPPSGSPIAYQPCFDTFTDFYESDGQVMETVSGMIVFAREGLIRFGESRPPLILVPDLGTDGLGNDDFEKETSPPIPYFLPAIQATIRVQDYSAGTLQQISVVHDLTNL